MEMNSFSYNKDTLFSFFTKKREAKLHGNPRNMADLVPKIGLILMAKINSNGTKVAFICEQVRWRNMFLVINEHMYFCDTLGY